MHFKINHITQLEHSNTGSHLNAIVATKYSTIFVDLCSFSILTFSIHNKHKMWIDFNKIYKFLLENP